MLTSLNDSRDTLVIGSVTGAQDTAFSQQFDLTGRNWRTLYILMQTTGKSGGTNGRSVTLTRYDAQGVQYGVVTTVDFAPAVSQQAYYLLGEGVPDGGYPTAPNGNLPEPVPGKITIASADTDCPAVTVTVIGK